MRRTVVRFGTVVGMITIVSISLGWQSHYGTLYPPTNYRILPKQVVGDWKIDMDRSKLPSWTDEVHRNMFATRLHLSSDGRYRWTSLRPSSSGTWRVDGSVLKFKSERKQWTPDEMQISKDAKSMYAEKNLGSRVHEVDIRITFMRVSG